MPNLLKELKDMVKGLPHSFKMLWINPGHMRWVNKMPVNGFVSWIDIAKKGGHGVQKAKLGLVGVLTLPVGLPVALVTLPIVFFKSGVPYLRTEHLNKFTKMLAGNPWKLCNENGKTCARQVAKLMTAIGHPRVERICEKCRQRVEQLANEAAEEIQEGNVQTDPDDVKRLMESRENDSDVDVD